MKPIEPFELSGYLDRELDPKRMSQVADAIARDPTLKRELDKLTAMDAKWRDFARTAIETPQVALEIRSRRVITITLAVVGLVALRFIPNIVDVVSVEVVVHAAVLLVTLTWVARTTYAAHEQLDP